MSLIWYNQHWRGVETPAFVFWFEDLIKGYGPPEAFEANVPGDEQDEYWTRRGFALMGWLAGRRSG